MQIIEGEVIHGNALGRTMGFPTANIDVPQHVHIPSGVYCSTVDVSGHSYRAMTNVGLRPTVGGTRRVVESHILDFCGDIYGQHLRITLHAKVRDERKFDSLDALKQQLMLDAAHIRTMPL